MNATPIAVLEKECDRRHLSIAYTISGVKEADSMHGKHFIMQVAVSGEWREVYQGDVRRVTETRTFQGIGKST